MNKPIYLSLILPVFNEQKRIDKGLKTIIGYLKSQKYFWEIVLVDDGSTDQTAKVAKKLLKNVPHQILQHKINHGKGAAVKTGMLQAAGKYIVFTDIDLSTPITELPKLLTALKNYTVAIGVRRHPQSLVLKHQPKLREALGQVFTKLTNWLVTPGIYDVTCGFKGFRREVAQKLFTKSQISGWAFDAEILFLARKMNLSITQIPVVWRNDPATRVKLLRDGLVALRDLLKIRLGV